MQWELAHRPRGVYNATTVTIDAPSGWAAVEQLRAQIPEGDLVLYVLTGE
jgi:hypothetical protein